MNTYKVAFTDRAKKELKKLDKPTLALIIGWIEKNLEGCTNPRVHGKGLLSNRSGQWRYRIGSYRIIADIDENTVTILILSVGLRSDVYKKRR